MGEMTRVRGGCGMFDDLKRAAERLALKLADLGRSL
jgi:hypothetical protein